jgi:hypothetical protein
MPATKRQAFCNVHIDDHGVTADHFSGIQARAKRRYASKDVSRDRLNTLISSYWEFVDRRIRAGVLEEGDAIALQKFMDELKARGSEIAGALFSKETQRGVWKAAAESDVFVISTR